jgi:hypothetical protein
MKRHLCRLTLAAALSFTVGVSPSVANTITSISDYAALHPGEGFTIGSTVADTCEPGTVFSVSCTDVTDRSFVAPDNINSGTDDRFFDAGSVLLPGSLTGVLARGTLDATLPASLEVTELTLDNNQILFLPFKRVSLPSSSDQPGAAIANATPLQVVTPAAAVAEVPEPGSLLLLGSSLLLFARVVRSRVK